MPICDPCAKAADKSTRLSGGHSPNICRDHGRAGCGCQHRPVGSATNGEDQPQ